MGRVHQMVEITEELQETNESLLAKLANLPKASQEACELRNYILLKNVKLIQKVCHEFYPFIKKSAILDFGDLEQEGIISLLNAINSYDYTQNSLFSKYAYFSIRNGLMRFANKNTNQFHASEQKKIRFSRFKKCEHELELKLQRKPTKTELSQEIGVSVQKLYDLERIGTNFVSIDAQIFESDTQGNTYEAIISTNDYTYENIDDRLDFEVFYKKLDTILEKLKYSKDQENVLHLIILGYSREEIVEKLNITYKKVQTIFDVIKKSRNFDIIRNVFEEFYELGVYSEDFKKDFKKEYGYNFPSTSFVS